MTKDKRLAALWKIADHIPENWGDECKDGYVRLNISADAIEAVQAAIMPIAEDADRLAYKAALDEIVELDTRIDGLLEALLFAQNVLENLTTEQFSRGEDKPMRDKIDEAIRHAKDKTIELEKRETINTDLLEALEISTTALQVVYKADRNNISAKVCIERNQQAIRKAEEK